MKNKFIPFIFGFILSANIFGQNWAPFQFDQHYYISKSTLTTEEPTVSFKEGEIINLISDSVSGGATFPDLFIGCDVRDKNSSCFNSLESCSDRFSWVGSPVMMETSQWSTINRDGDTLRFQSFSAADTILRKSDTLYILHLIGLDSATIINQMDSVVHYKIEVRDSNGILTSSQWNGDTIILSKTSGFIRLPSWYLFPRNEAWFELFEHERTSDFSYNDVYPYQAGNVLHFRYDWENGNMLGDITFEKSVLKQCTIISVDSSAVTNKFQVQCLQQTTEKYYSPDFPYGLDSSNSSILMDTILWSSSTLALFQKDMVKETTALTQDGNDLQIHKEDIWVGLPSAQCPWEQDQFEPSYGSSTNIRVGLGEIEHHSFSHSNFPFGSYSTHNRKLLYFKSNVMEYGSPSWPIGVVENGSEYDFMIWPNPSPNLVTISSVSAIEELWVFNPNGLIVKKLQINSQQTAEIQLNGLPNGLYYLRIKTENTTVTKKILKLAK